MSEWFLEKTNDHYIDGVVKTNGISHAEFDDLFTEWVESHGWTFQGMTQPIGEVVE